jgi:integrase
VKSSPILAPAQSALGILTAAVRPEFRHDILVPPPSHPMFSYGVCEVASCDNQAFTRKDLCNAHVARWRLAKAEGADRSQWLATETPIHTYASCIVAGCLFARKSHGLCSRHTRLWSLYGSAQDSGQWAGQATPLADPRQQLECVFPGCGLWRDGKQIFCANHFAQWKRLGKANPGMTFEDFAVKIYEAGVPTLDVRGLPSQLALEIQYVFQCWVDHGKRRANVYMWNPAMRLLRSSGAQSFLDHTPEEWKRLINPGAGGRPSVSFLAWGYEQVDTLLNGVGWHTEYERDSWRLTRLSHPEYPKRTLSFTSFRLPWLRELAKQWIRHRLSVGFAVNTVTLDLAAVRDFSEYLQSGALVPESARQLSRSLIEGWTADLALRMPLAEQRVGRLSSVRAFLRDVHQFEWAHGLPASSTIYPQDMPREKRSLPERAVSEFVMSQIEAEPNIAKMANLDYRLILELMIRCGLRISDAMGLKLDCLVADGDANPYLHYYNHKMRRDAYIPVDEGTAERLRGQQLRVHSRYESGSATVLFPAYKSNPDGVKALQTGGFRRHFTKWLAAIAVSDELGRPVRITPHQFRHTFGTRLINRDVPQHIVQQLLDHTSAEMTSHYARLHDKTVRDSWEKARKINARGEEVTLEEDHPLADAQWTRAGLDRAKQTLPNGYCGMPVQSACEHANPCLTCPLFITTPEFLPQHEAQLRTTLELIDVSKSKGHGRIVEKNEEIVENLTRIIGVCRGCSPNEIVVGGRAAAPEAS